MVRGQLARSFGHVARCRAPHEVQSHNFDPTSIAIQNALQGVKSYGQHERVIQLQLGQTARQKQADKEFFTALLSSAATKRDAKAYLKRLSPSRKKPLSEAMSLPLPHVNVGSLVGRATAVEQSPVFSQQGTEQIQLHEEQDILHVALVRLTDVNTLDEAILGGIAQTLSHLSRLSMAPCLVVDMSIPLGPKSRGELEKGADRLVAAIEAVHSPGARKLDTLLTFSDDSGQPEVVMRNLLLKPLRRGQIPVILPIAYSAETQTVASLSTDVTILALTREFSEVNSMIRQDSGLNIVAQQLGSPPKQISLDRIILVDSAGGVPDVKSNKTKVFINLEQEYSNIRQSLSDAEYSPRHNQNLDLLRNALKYLPPSSSGLITTPADAANSIGTDEESGEASSVRTRRQKNALIHNLLTDKPAYSSSLPTGRLSRKPVTSVMSTSTFVKRGMPLTILPDPSINPWTASGSGQSRLKLTDPRLDLQALTHLIDDSFGRKLDIDHYLRRVNDRIAGVIIAGDYEGGAILTWETPPGADDADETQLVPYLDKFAVLRRSQGAGGVADIVFSAMVEDCFPHGVCWRSRKDNPVNKWYFERSRGTWKIPDMNWTMFWTTPGVVDGGKMFQNYEGVCRGVVPSWTDKKQAAD